VPTALLLALQVWRVRTKGAPAVAAFQQYLAQTSAALSPLSIRLADAGPAGQPNRMVDRTWRDCLTFRPGGQPHSAPNIHITGFAAVPAQSAMVEGA
jgi:hypothetical protein